MKGAKFKSCDKLETGSRGFDKQRLEKPILQKYSEVKDIVPTESNTADGDKLALWVWEKKPHTLTVVLDVFQVCVFLKPTIFSIVQPIGMSSAESLKQWDEANSFPGMRALNRYPKGHSSMCFGTSSNFCSDELRGRLVGQ